jgi:hypothetical protein
LFTILPLYTTLLFCLFFIYPVQHNENSLLTFSFSLFSHLFVIHFIKLLCIFFLIFHSFFHINSLLYHSCNKVVLFLSFLHYVFVLILLLNIIVICTVICIFYFPICFFFLSFLLMTTAGTTLEISCTYSLLKSCFYSFFSLSCRTSYISHSTLFTLSLLILILFIALLKLIIPPAIFFFILAFWLCYFFLFLFCLSPFLDVEFVNLSFVKIIYLHILGWV